MRGIAEFLFEVGFLHKTPRTGFGFLGTGHESVSEHMYRSAVIGFVLSKLEPTVNSSRLLALCLFHDLAEARTGDQNYVYKQYTSVNEAKAFGEVCAKLPFGKELEDIHGEYLEGRTIEARLAHDADQLDLLLSLKEQLDLGNAYASDWIENVRRRLHTETAQTLARAIMQTDHKDWWLKDHDEWWAKKT